MNTDLSIIIVNWKVAELIHDLLSSVARETAGIEYEIFVVDNASSDHIEGVVDDFKKAHAKVPIMLLKNASNLGFAAACNRGIRLAHGRHVVLLNPDTRVVDGALQKMVAWLDAHPDVGVAGPKLTEPDGSLQPSVRRLPGIINQLLVLLKLPHVWRSHPVLRHYYADDFDYSMEADVEQVKGAAFFMSREALRKVGTLDERFFIWFEEVDFCKRVRDAGLRVVYTPIATIMHHGGRSFAREMTFRKQRYFIASMLKYVQKHRGTAAAIVLAMPAALVLSVTAMFSLWNTLRSEKRS